MEGVVKIIYAYIQKFGGTLVWQMEEIRQTLICQLAIYFYIIYYWLYSKFA